MEKDPSLDFTSDQFDALKALYAKDLKPPSDEVRAYDNLAAYWAAVQRQSSVKGSDQAISSHDRPKTASALARSRKDVKINDIATTSARSINYEKKNKHREKVTVLERMQRPFSILYKALNERKLIHIWTRSYNKLRGICRGYLAAFDKHMNIVLVDVDEVHTLPHYFMRTVGGKHSSKALAETATHQSTATAVLQLLANDSTSEAYSSSKGITASALKSVLQHQITSSDQFRRIENFNITEDVIKTDHSSIIVKRSLRQIYIRGENIVLASLANAD